ncbi:MAG: TolC family protein [Phycisphaerae bacterium]|nr:TolC family protein [Phycisphaerae bacterium]
MSIRCPLRRRHVVGAVTLLVPPLLHGCAQYQPRPIDRAETESAFLARLPDPAAATELFAATAPLDGAGPSAFDLADGLSPREAEVIALLLNPRLRTERAKLGVTLANATYAGLWDDPVLGTDIIRYFNSSENLWQWSAALNLTLPISGRLEAELERAGVEHAAELLRVAADEWKVRLDVRDAWVRYSATQARIELLDALLVSVDEIVGNAERLEAAGELSRVETSLFRIEQSARRAERMRAETESRTAQLALRTLLGLPPSAAVTFTPSLEAPIEPALAAASARRVRDNPEIAVAQAAYEVAEKSLALEVRRQYPDVTIGPGGGDDQGDPNVLLGVSLPIPLWNRNQRGVAEATARREVAQRDVESAIQTAIGELSVAEAALVGVRAEREHLETNLVPLADAEIADAKKLAALGEMNVVVLVDAVVRQLDAHLTLLDAREREARAAFAVLRLVGPESPTSPVPESTP